MARTTINRLSDRRVKTTKTGMHADGGGLYLRVTEGRPGDDEGPVVLKRYWVFRYRQRNTRKDRQLGIVGLPRWTDAESRDVVPHGLGDGLDAIASGDSRGGKAGRDRRGFSA